MSAIRINQMGYTPNSVKQFIIIGDKKRFQLLRAEEDQPVYEGSMTEARFDKASGDYVGRGDFSAVTEQGDYYIQVGDEKSCVFTISNKQPEICTDALLKAFYYQRCGVELSEEYADGWKHPACHLQPSYLFCQEAEQWLREHPERMIQRDTAGGWHDAGDYGRYTIATVKAVADLLLAYEQFPNALNRKLNIPESSMEGPDILYEVKVGLDFLLKMQNQSDGSVYTKVTSRYFPAMIMPDEDREPLFVFNSSSPATGGFAAVMAMAARVYNSFDPVYAARCLKAAEKAYQWLEQNPQPKLFNNPSDVKSGEYGDNNDLDERYWAAAELYRTTGEERYHEAFLQLFPKLKDRLTLGWRSVGGYGSVAYLFSGKTVNTETFVTLKEEWLSHANALASRSDEDGYGITLSLEEYVWGSNMLLLNQSMQLIYADRMTKETKYGHVIQSNWDYLFGKNPMDISYVTGLGSRSVMSPHHRPSQADQVMEPVPGLLAGGPCDRLQDEVAKSLLTGLPKAKCFVDHSESYSTNEIDIYWNSPAVHVGAYLCLFQ